MTDVAWASLFTAVAGIISTVSAWYLSRGKTKNDFVMQFQEAVQKDLQGWKDEAKAFKAEAQKWRDEVYTWRDKFEEISNENGDLKRENNSLRDKVDHLEGDVKRMKQILKENNIDHI